MYTSFNIFELEQQKATVSKYLQLSRNIRWTSASLCEHGIGVCRINEKSFIFDTGRQSAVKLKSVLDLA